MSLCEQFRTDLTQAMKSGDKVRLATLRLLTAAIKNRQIDKGGTLDDAEALEVVRLATKQRREAIALARQYGREDIAQQEEQELAILEAYLPEQLSTDDLIQRIDAIIQELGATSDKDLGRVMRALMPAVKGRADGTTVNRLVRGRLAGPLPVGLRAAESGSMNDHTEGGLDFLLIRNVLQAYTVTPMGKTLASRLHPHADITVLEVQLRETSEMAATLAIGADPPLAPVVDIHSYLEAAHIVGFYLEGVQFLEV